MSLRGSFGPLALVVVVVLVGADPARAQSSADCEANDPGPCWVFPRPGTPEAVTLDAPVLVRFTPGFFDDRGVEAVAFELNDADTGAAVGGSLSIADDVLYFVPDGWLEPNTSYEGSIYAGDPEPREIQIGFRTGSFADSRPPVMGPILDVTPHPETEVAGFGEGSERVDIEFEGATDDGPLGSIEYLIFLTRGHGISAPVLRLRRLEQPGNIPAAIGMTADEAAEPACAAIVAVDGVGKTDASPEQCFDPRTGTFFEPLCSVSPHPTLPGVLGLVLPVGFALLARRRRRGRGARAPRR